MRQGTGGRRLADVWGDRSIRTKGLVVIAVPVAILVVVLGSTFWFSHVNNRAQDVAGRARQCTSGVSVLEDSLLSSQTAIRGYLLTADPAFRASYDQSQGVVPAEVGQVMDLTANGACQSQWGQVVVRDSARLTFDLAQLSAQAPGPVPSEAVQALLLFSQDETNQLRADVSALARFEAGVVASERSAIQSSNRILPAIAIAAVVLALSAGVIISLLFTTGVVTRLRRLERATGALERGEVGEVPTGRDEIGRLSARLLDTSAQLRQRAEERDRARSELEHILTASPVVSLRYDTRARRFSYASPNVWRLLGVSAQEAQADPQVIANRFHPESRHRLRDALVSGAGQSGHRLEILLKFRRDGWSEDWHEAEAVYTAETGPDGTLRAVVAYFIDVSQRQEAQRAAEERRLLLESIFHASPDTIVVRNIEGKVVLASSALAEMVGVPAIGPDDLIEEAYRIGSVPAHDRAVLDRLIARCMAGERSPEAVVTTGRLPDGVVRTFETRARPVVDGSGCVSGTVTVSRDVTERVSLEDSLRRASSEAERASAAKSEFLSRMSHELRTPLNSILGFAQLLELDDLSEDQASSVDQIQLAGRHLLALINEVLDISRIEAGRLSLSAEPVGVSDVLAEVTTLLAPEAEAAGIELGVEAGDLQDLSVQADRQRLLQVLLNLGSNALKYNRPNGSVTFRTALEGATIRFEVCDTGPGIPNEQMGQLFLPFSRLGAEHSAVEGTGVGLALSKQLVEAMGGGIGVRSTLGGGSTFWVALRRARAPRAARPGTTGPHEDAPGTESGVDRRARGVSGRRAEDAGAGGPGGSFVVLHVEDNPSNASLVEQVLARRTAVRLVCADSALTGLELARRHRPDLVLLDLHLPDLPGDELLRRLKTVPELAETKVVVVSADATASRIKKMLDMGVEGYLTKPVDVDALLQLVDHEIGARLGAAR